MNDKKTIAKTCSWQTISELHKVFVKSTITCKLNSFAVSPQTV